MQQSIVARSVSGDQQHIYLSYSPARIQEDLTGAGVLSAYGTIRHVHYIELSQRAVQQLIQLYASTTLEQALRRCFAPEQSFLADLMDALDRRGVPYTYGVLSGDTLVLRKSF